MGAVRKKIIEKSEILKKRFSILSQNMNLRYDPLKVEEKYRHNLSKEHILEKGAMDLLDYLKGKYKLYIVTNGTASNQIKRLHDSKLEGYFEDVFISEVIGCPKPQKEFFESAVSNINGFSKDKCLIIGDSLSSDIKGGINFSIDTMWYNPSHQIKPQDMNITYEVDSLYKIQTIL